MRSLGVLLLALLISACGSSPPTRFYTLDAVPPGHGAETDSGPPIEVGQVRIPASLDRLSFVTRTGPNRIDVSDQDRWAAPLDDMIRRMLAANLSSRLPAGRVLAPGDPAPLGRVLTVALNIRQFIGDAAGNVILDADWSVMDRKQHAVFTRHVSITRDARSGDAGSIAAAMSQALGELSEQIAVALSQIGRQSRST